MVLKSKFTPLKFFEVLSPLVVYLVTVDVNVGVKLISAAKKTFGNSCLYVKKI